MQFADDLRTTGPDPSRRVPDVDRISRMLIVLPTWVGDFVMATPFLRSVREKFVNAEVTYLIEPNLVDLVDGCPWPDSCTTWPSKGNRSPLSREFLGLIRKLRHQSFDLALLLPNSFRAALTAYLSGARIRVGYGRDGRGLLLTNRVPVRNLRSLLNDSHQHEHAWRPTKQALRIPPTLPVRPSRYVPMRLVDYYTDLALALGCDRPGDRFELFTTAASESELDVRLNRLGVDTRKPMIVLSPGARYGAAKCWMPERFAEVADLLVESHDATVLVTCGPGEEAIARRIGDAMKRDAHVLDDPRLSLAGLKSLVARCDLLICNDAGPRHFAKAFARPVVTVFGPTHPEWTATDYPDERVVRVDVDCGPCQQRTCPLGHLECMERISATMVHAAATDLLGKKKEA